MIPVEVRFREKGEEILEKWLVGKNLWKKEMKMKVQVFFVLVINLVITLYQRINFKKINNAVYYTTVLNH